MRRTPLLLCLLLLAACARLGGDGAQWSHNAVLPLSEDESVGQTFSVASDALVGIDLLVATYAQAADPGGELQVSLTDATSGAQLASTSTPGTAITDNAWVPVRFDPPVEVDGPVAAQIRWTGSSPVGVRANRPRDAEDADVLENDPYPYGQLLVDGVPVPGDLAFRVVGSNGLEVLPATFAGLLRGAISGLAQQPAFAIAWSALLLGCAVLAVAGFSDSRRRRGAAELAKGRRDQQGRRDRERGADEPE